ncbi:SPY protein [Plesiocystis pacifica SIR-1]|uniref:SPY protein n=1 Tax=Plesiocystis pacifica SIR-1 TaxID=391625 RepID=A6GKN3_9BACT|nr:tetratricopeptide repeat protein [Plesiocystis pacifica]EDM73568.1 SPY protein [Plesiocystis pacifica SIR-1]
MATSARRATLGFLAAFALALSACGEPKPATTTPGEGEGEDEALGDAQLTGQGPGGGLSDRLKPKPGADPAIVEIEVLIAQGKPERALEAADAAIAADPKKARLRYARGNALSHLGRSDEARAAFDEAIALDDTDALPHAAIGNLVGLSEGATVADKKRAIDHFQTALKLDPELASAHLALGVVLLDLREYQRAVEAIETADRLKGSVDTAYTLAQVHARLGNDEQALNYAESALEYEANASGVDIRLLYARLLMKAGRDADAAEQFERCAKLVPDAPPLRLEVVRGLLDMGMVDAAAVHMDALLEMVPDEGPVLVNHGRVLAAQGDIEGALGRFAAAREAQPESQAAWVYEVQTLAAAKRCKEAEKAATELAVMLGYVAPKKDPNNPPRAVRRAQDALAAHGCR